MTNSNRVSHKAHMLMKGTQSSFNPEALLPFRKKCLEKAKELAAKESPWTAYESSAFSSFLKDSFSDEAPLYFGAFAPEEKWFEVITTPLPIEGRLLYPHIDYKTESLAFYDCTLEELIPHPQWNVLHAPEKGERITPQLLFVPAIAVDKTGRRLGRGGGFYDRFIQSHKENMLSCCLIHSSFLHNKLPDHYFHELDQKVDFILTENEWINCKENTSC